MKSSVFYEIKKLIKARSTLILCVLLAIFNIVISFFGVPEDNTVTQEKYDTVASSIIYTAKINLSQIVDKESENALYQKDIIARFEELQVGVKVSPVKGFDSVLSSPYPSICALIFAAYAALHIALSEYSADLILLSFKKKRAEIGAAKLLVLVACALGAVLFFNLCYSLGTLFVSGFGGALAPLQSVLTYIRCPYEINVLTALVFRMFFSFSTVLLAAIAVFFSSLAAKKIIPSLICVVTLIGADSMLTNAASADIFSLFYSFNFRTLIYGDYLARYSGMKLGVFVIQPYIIIAVISLATAVLGALALLIFCRSGSIKSIGARRGFLRKGSSHGKNLGFYELKNLFRGKTIIIIAILVIFKVIALDTQVVAPNSDYENVYKYYIAEIEYMSYNTQGAYVTREREKCFEKMLEAEEYMNAYADGTVDDHDKFLEYASELGAYELKYDVLCDINTQLAKVSTVRAKGLDAKLIYATGWNSLFSLEPDYICTVLLAFVILPYIMLDKECAIAPILTASLEGRKDAKKRLLLSKLLVMLGFAVFFAISFFALDIWLVNKRIGLSSIGEYAVGTVLPESFWSLRLWQVLLLRTGMALLGISLIITISHLIRKIPLGSMPALLIFIGIQLLAVLISRTTDIFFIFDISSFFGFAV